MPKKKRPEEKPDEQFKRFVETARDVDVDVDDAEREFKAIARGRTKREKKAIAP